MWTEPAQELLYKLPGLYETENTPLKYRRWNSLWRRRASFQHMNIKLIDSQEWRTRDYMADTLAFHRVFLFSLVTKNGNCPLLWHVPPQTRPEPARRGFR